MIECLVRETFSVMVTLSSKPLTRLAIETGFGFWVEMWSEWLGLRSREGYPTQSQARDT
jgi:hypothetical protein